MIADHCVWIKKYNSYFLSCSRRILTNNYKIDNGFIGKKILVQNVLDMTIF